MIEQWFTAFLDSRQPSVTFRKLVMSLLKTYLFLTVFTVSGSMAPLRGSHVIAGWAAVNRTSLRPWQVLWSGAWSWWAAWWGIWGVCGLIIRSMKKAAVIVAGGDNGCWRHSQAPSKGCRCRTVLCPALSAIFPYFVPDGMSITPADASAPLGTWMPVIRATIPCSPSHQLSEHGRGGGRSQMKKHSLASAHPAMAKCFAQSIGTVSAGAAGGKGSACQLHSFLHSSHVPKLVVCSVGNGARIVGRVWCAQDVEDQCLLPLTGARHFRTPQRTSWHPGW